MLQTAHTFEHTPKNQKTRKSLFINELRGNFVVPPGSFRFYFVLFVFL